MTMSAICFLCKAPHSRLASQQLGDSLGKGAFGQVYREFSVARDELGQIDGEMQVPSIGPLAKPSPSKRYN